MKKIDSFESDSASTIVFIKIIKKISNGISPDFIRCKIPLLNYKHKIILNSNTT